MTPELNRIYQGDCRNTMRQWAVQGAKGFVHTCVTSPPYFGLRDYGHDGQIGLEESPDKYIRGLVEVFREVRTALRDDGTLWLNLGDSYASDTKGSGGPSAKQDSNAGSMYAPRKFNHGVKAKDLMGIPWAVAFALREDGWYLRSDIIWSKPNPMPESVTDRPTKAHEYLFLLTKRPDYFCDMEAIKEKAVVGANGSTFDGPRDMAVRPTTGRGPRFGGNKYPDAGSDGPYSGNEYESNGMRNKRSVWTVPSAAFSESHFATFPPDLIRPCILAGTSERGVCDKCGAPWVREIESTKYEPPIVKDGEKMHVDESRGDKNRKLFGAAWAKQARSKTVGWLPSCDCHGIPSVDSIVLDPFMGAGTTALVALELNRRFIGCELNPEYIKIAEERIANEKAQGKLF